MRDEPAGLSDSGRCGGPDSKSAGVSAASASDEPIIRTPFPVRAEDHWGEPPAGNGQREDDAPRLARRLWELLEVAGSATIPALDPKPRIRLPDEFEAIVDAAASFDIAPGLPLARHLWTRCEAFWSGEMDKALSLQRCDNSAPAVLLLFAQGAGRRAAILGFAQPFVVDDEIEGDFGTGGPYLVLIECARAPSGRATAVRGYAQPILSSKYFMPVRSAFERDAFDALLSFRQRLASKGFECVISRALTEEGPGQALRLDIRVVNASSRRLRMIVDSAASDDHADDEDAGYRITQERLADGSFTAWLDEQANGLDGKPDSRGKRRGSRAEH